MNIHICGFDFTNSENYITQSEIIEQLFPNKYEAKQIYDLRTSSKPKWKAFIYKTNDYPIIIKTILSQIEIGTKNAKKEYKNNMILCFGDNNNDLLLCQELTKKETRKQFAHNFPLILFVFREMIKKNVDYRDKLFDFTYIKCVNYIDLTKIQLDDEENNDVKISKIKLIVLSLKSLLSYHYDNYFNENGFNSLKHLDPLSFKIKTGVYLPILLIGCPGVGKSSFINVFAGERISKASSAMEPVTSKIAYYDVKIPENQGDNNDNELNNELLNEDVFIRFIDTPGFDTKKDVQITKDEIEKIYKDFKNGKEHIPVILYFLQNGRSFSLDDNKKELELLDYLKNKNAKIVFIITRSTEDRWEQTDSFIQFLTEKQLQNLVEKDESNIFACNLRGRNAFGFKEIFKKLYSMLNIINGNEVFNESLINELKAKPTFNEKIKLLKEKTNFFEFFNSKNDIIKTAELKADLLIGSLSTVAAIAGACPIPFADVVIVQMLIITAILSIGYFYGYIYKKVSKQDLLTIFKGGLYCKDKKIKDEYFDANVSSVNTCDKVNKISIIKNINAFIISSLTSSVLTAGALFIDDGFKFIPIIGSIIGAALGAICDFGLVINFGINANKYYKSKCEADDGTLFFCTRCYEYIIIFKKFKKFDSFNLIYPP